MIKSSLLLCFALSMLVAASYSLGESNPLFLSETYYKGYIPVGEGSLFYWLFDSRHKPNTDPLIIWLQGGPGCATMQDVVNNNGPFILDRETGTLSLNPYSWNNKANVLFVDQPRGVGYSTAKAVIGNGEQVAEDFHSFLGDFLEKFPQFKGRDLYITGQSYAGHYIPGISKLIHERGDLDINFLGIAIGNGLFDKIYEQIKLPDYTYANGLIDETTYKAYKKLQEYCVQLIKEGNAQDAENDACWIGFGQYIYEPNTIPNLYDIRLKAPYDTAYIDNFFLRADVQKILGVAEGVVYQTCNFNIYDALIWDQYASYIDELSYLLTKGLKVLQYHGVEDWVGNWMGGENCAVHLDWRGNCKFKYRNYVQWKNYGEYRQVDNFVFLKVFNAGHMVPHDQPQVAYKMLEKWIHGW